MERLIKVSEDYLDWLIKKRRNKSWGYLTKAETIIIESLPMIKDTTTTKVSPYVIDTSVVSLIDMQAKHKQPTLKVNDLIQVDKKYIITESNIAFNCKECDFMDNCCNPAYNIQCLTKKSNLILTKIK